MIHLAVLLLLAATEKPPEVPAPPHIAAVNDELQAYLLEAAENSPKLQMRYAEWKAALARIPQATALDDPQFAYTSFLQSSESRFKASIMQMFPWFGTLRVRGEQAGAEAEAALARLYVERNMLFQEIKEAYFEYAFLHDSLETTQRQMDILKDMEDIVSARYGVGISEEADVLRVQIEQSELEDQYNQFLQQRPVFSARLASALGRETAEVLPWPQPAPAPPSPPPVPLVMAWLRTQNPLLQESEALIEGRQHEIELAKKRGRPNISVGLEFEDMKSMTMPPEWPYMLGVDTARGIVSGDAAMIAAARSDAISESIAEIYMSERNRARDEVMLTVGFSLPVWRKRVRAGVEEARQMEQAAVADKRDRMLELDVEARMALFDMQDGARRFNLYRDVLLPRAQQTYDSLQGRYASGDTNAGFLDVLGSIQALLNTELEQIRALRDIQIGGARLERVLGGPWTEQAEAESSPSPITIVEK